MGVINCPIHGNLGFYEVCEHVWNDLEKEVFPEMKELPGVPVKICSDCYKRNNIKEIEVVPYEELSKLDFEQLAKEEEKIRSAYETINISSNCICVECLNYVQLVDTKRNGKELPFEPFENTLMHKDDEIIKRLEKTLSSNYKFRRSKSIFGGFRDAFYIRSGGISYPLLIMFYYVTKEQEQKLLLELIDNFFEDITQKQRQVRFYESENWIVEVRENGSSTYKGEEKLLFEQLIK